MKQSLIMSWIRSIQVSVSKRARRLAIDDFFLGTLSNMCLEFSKSLTFILTWPNKTLWKHKNSMTSLSQLRKYFLNYFDCKCTICLSVDFFSLSLLRVIVSALSDRKENTVGLGSIKIEKDRNQTEVFGSRSISKCPNGSLVANW